MIPGVKAGEPDRRYPRWHPTHGPGIFVSVAGKIGGRFEADSGAVFPLDAVEVKSGRPGKKLVTPSGTRPGNEEYEWFTYTLRTGETFMLRTGAP